MSECNHGALAQTHCKLENRLLMSCWKIQYRIHSLLSARCTGRLLRWIIISFVLQQQSECTTDLSTDLCPFRLLIASDTLILKKN